MTKRSALVTGANKGIGFETVRQLARLGFTVWLAARDGQRGRTAIGRLRDEGLEAHPVSLDVNDKQSIACAVELISARDGKLDVLINNAGILAGRTPPSLTPDGDLRRVFDTNFFGLVAVTQAMIPLLRQGEASRIVNVSSKIGSLTQSSDPNYEFYKVKSLSYSTSKAAVNMATIQFAYELEKFGIKVNAADPGHTATDLNGNTGRRTTEEASRVILQLATLPPNGPNGCFYDENGPVDW